MEVGAVPMWMPSQKVRFRLATRYSVEQAEPGRGATLGNRQHHDLGADLDAVIEVDDVLVGHADASGCRAAADGRGSVGAVDAVETTAEIHGARARRIGRAARHETRQIRGAGNHLRPGRPMRALGLALDGLDAGPGETLTADANAVADRLAAAEDQVEIRVRRIDDDGARRLVGRIVDGHPPEVGPHLVAVIAWSVAQTEPAKWIGGCLRGEGARGNDDGGERRKTAQLVHDRLPFPCLLVGRGDAKVQNWLERICGRGLSVGLLATRSRIEWRGARPPRGPKETPAVGDLTAGALSRRSIRHGHEGEP